MYINTPFLCDVLIYDINTSILYYSIIHELGVIKGVDIITILD